MERELLPHILLYIFHYNFYPRKASVPQRKLIKSVRNIFALYRKYSSQKENIYSSKYQYIVI